VITPHCMFVNPLQMNGCLIRKPTPAAPAAAALLPILPEVTTGGVKVSIVETN
jgi:hypothetical protein